MSSALIFLSFLQILGVHGGFQDGIAPRAPQAAATTAGPAACSAVDDAISFCSSAIPGFATADDTELANCFCYSSTSWIPDVFDGAVYTCAQYAATAFSASAYSDIAGLEGYCSSLGNLEASGAPAAVSATATTSAAEVTPAPASGTIDIFTNSACAFVGSALSYCNSVSPGFTTMDPSSQAPCLCYSSTVWNPTEFDGAVLTCAEFVSSAAPSSLSDITDLEAFCTDIGNVLGSGTGATGSGGNGIPLASSTGGVTSSKHTATSKPGLAATIATPVATTIQEGPASTKQSLASSDMKMGIWGFGLGVVAVSMMILA
jgi:hypothetical protein